jgi:hypothetical protein
MVNLNEGIQVGLIDCGGMGRRNLANCARYADVAVMGICDVWHPNMMPMQTVDSETRPRKHMP